MAVTTRSRHHTKGEGYHAKARPEVDGAPGIVYPVLAEVRASLRVPWYRCPVGEGGLKRLMVRSNASGAVQALGHLGLWACTGALVMHQAAAGGGALGFLGALFLHGTVGSCFLFACHELGHGTVFRTRALNRFFLYVFSLLSWWDPFEYALSHYHHHM